MIDGVLGEVEIDLVDGNGVVYFDDAQGQECSLVVVDGLLYVIKKREDMALGRDQVASLIAALQRWLDTGSFMPVERVEVVVRQAKHWEGLSPLVNAIRNADPGTTLVVQAARHVPIGFSIVQESYAGKDITFRVADPALAPVGECACGAARAAETGRCEDGCDDD